MNSKDSKKKKWNIAIKNEIKNMYDMIKMLVVDINSIPKKKKKRKMKILFQFSHLQHIKRQKS